MPLTSREYGIRSARRIVPLGAILGLLLLVPLTWYVLWGGGLNSGDALEYGIVSVAVLLGYLTFVLLFLWCAECADEREADQEQPPPPGQP